MRLAVADGTPTLAAITDVMPITVGIAVMAITVAIVVMPITLLASVLASWLTAITVGAVHGCIAML
jgi:hypothetical protein